MPPSDRLKDGFLHVCKACGLFRLSRYLTRRGVRILCYHGFQIDDEVAFRPSLFITPETFARRLAALSDARYPVVSLEAALSALDGGTTHDAMTVVTIDDVFNSVVTEAVPILERYHATATLYVTSYYCTKDAPVFRLLVRYAFWKTRQAGLDLSALHDGLRDQFNLTDPANRARAEEAVITCGEAFDAESARENLADRLGRLLDVDLASVRKRRMFHVVTPDQVKGLAARRFDIQLHTHRHRLLVDQIQVLREVADNRRVLEPLVGRPLEHLCYPSGVWTPLFWPWLQKANVVSATTCDAGLNYSKTPRLALKRILDAEDVSQIRFEAEMSGFRDLLRKVRAWFRPSAGAPTPGVA